MHINYDILHIIFKSVIYLKFNINYNIKKIREQLIGKCILLV